MKSVSKELIEHIFFFAILGGSAYMVWKLFSPFVGALALAAIIVTICYPLYERILHALPRKNQGIAALLSLLLILFIIIAPLAFLGSLILREAVSIYSMFSNANQNGFVESLSQIEGFVQNYIPSFSVDVASVVQQTAQFFVDHLVNVFTGTASTIFLFFIALIASYYFFKDGKYFTSYLVRLSPLKDTDDSKIIGRLARAVRSVALGSLAIAVLQGVLTAIGFSVAGFERWVLWGCIAAIGALIPGVGTAIVFAPAVIYLLYTGALVPGVLLLLWGVLAVGLADNFVGPYVMSKGNNMHPFLILLSVLGGLAFFGPIGFILGPVILSLFLVLLELYHTYIRKEEGSS